MLSVCQFILLLIEESEEDLSSVLHICFSSLQLIFGLQILFGVSCFMFPLLLMGFWAFESRIRNYIKTTSFLVVFELSLSSRPNGSLITSQKQLLLFVSWLALSRFHVFSAGQAAAWNICEWTGFSTIQMNSNACNVQRKTELLPILFFTLSTKPWCISHHYFHLFTRLQSFIMSLTCIFPFIFSPAEIVSSLWEK